MNLKYWVKDEMNFENNISIMKEDNIDLHYAKWRYTNEDGTQTKVITEKFAHPLNMVGLLHSIAITNDPTEFEISFSLAPESYKVLFWPEFLVNTPGAEVNYIEYFEVENHKFIVPSGRNGYIILVRAEWNQGTADYAFHIMRPNLNTKFI